MRYLEEYLPHKDDGSIDWNSIVAALFWAALAILAIAVACGLSVQGIGIIKPW